MFCVGFNWRQFDRDAKFELFARGMTFATVQASCVGEKMRGDNTSGFPNTAW